MYIEQQGEYAYRSKGLKGSLDISQDLPKDLYLP